MAAALIVVPYLTLTRAADPTAVPPTREVSVTYYGADFVPPAAAALSEEGGEYIFLEQNAAGEAIHLYLSSRQLAFVRRGLLADPALDFPATHGLEGHVAHDLSAVIPFRRLFMPPSAAECLTLLNDVANANISAFTPQEKQRVLMNCIAWTLGFTYGDTNPVNAALRINFTIVVVPTAVVTAFYHIPRAAFNKSMVMQLICACAMSLKKSFRQNTTHFTEFIKLRTNAFFASMQDSTQVMATLSTNFAELSHIWEYSFQLQEFYIQQLIGGFPGPATLYKNAFTTQARLICAHAGMSAYEMAMRSLPVLWSTPLGTNPVFINEMMGGFLRAKKFQEALPEAQRPYTMILRPNGYEVLHHRNWPIMAYAGAAAQKQSGKQSMMNYQIDDRLDATMKIMVDQTLDWLKKNMGKPYPVDEATVKAIQLEYVGYTPYQGEKEVSKLGELVELLRLAQSSI